jgi:DNA-binding NtrC family response regulator
MTMSRFLMIDRDRTMMQDVGLACFEQGIGVVLAENVCEAVRALSTTSVSLIVVDASLLRLTPAEHAAMFTRVAPSVNVVVVVSPEATLESRVAYEAVGFRALTRPVTAEDLLKEVALSGLSAC